MTQTTRKAGFWQYVKRAFVVHWNLLAVTAGVAAGVISGHADVVVPLVAAGELVYLTGLASNSRFQAHVDAQAHKAQQAQQSALSDAELQQIFAALDPRSRARFEALKRRCRELRQLSGASANDEHLRGIESQQLDGVNRLLWVFLKLLHARHALERFLATTNEREIREAIGEIQARLDSLGPQAQDTPAEVRMRQTLIDTLQSANARMENLARARENRELIELEVDRIDAKITSLAELAVSRQDPNFITSEVDNVSAAVAGSERTMHDLRLISGLGTVADSAPPPSFLEDKTEVQS